MKASALRVRPFLRLILLSGAACALALSPAQARKKKAEPLPPAENGLIDNVNGLSIGVDGRISHFTGLLIDKEGRVKQRLSTQDKRPDHLRFRMDGKGRTLIPSFVDGHTSLIKTGIARMTLDLSGARSFAETKAMIAAYARENQGRKWILGRGWNPAGWGTEDSDALLPTAADLDAVISDIPVWLESADGEMGWANSLAMKQAAISATTQSPPTGRIIMAGGKPSGLFTGGAMDLISHIIPPPAPKDRDVALDKAQPLFLAAGISSIADMGTSLDDWQSLRRAGDRGALRLRISGYASGITDMVTIAGPGPTPWLYGDHLRLGGVHFTLDGSIAARTAWLKAPYADAPAEKGAMRIDTTRLRNQMSRAAMDGFQIALSASGDAAVEEAIYAIDELAATYEGDRRWRIEGADIIAPNDKTRLNAHGALVTAHPALLVDPGEAATLRRRLGAERPFGIPIGLNSSLGLGSWAGGAVSSPFISIAAAMGYRGNAQIIVPDTERLSFAQALAAHTINAAYAIQAEKRIGALELGQWADFLLLDRDISTSTPDAIAATRLMEHWMAGQRVWMAGETITTSESPSASDGGR
ncbi:MAG: amidohydrolase [Sphingobium sp.]|nr:amidohydrolase [Sphingobium sp.]